MVRSEHISSKSGGPGRGAGRYNEEFSRVFPLLSSFPSLSFSPFPATPEQQFHRKVHAVLLLSVFSPLAPITQTQLYWRGNLTNVKWMGLATGNCVSQDNICLYFKSSKQRLSEKRDPCMLLFSVFSNCWHYPLVTGCVRDMI